MGASRVRLGGGASADFPSGVSRGKERSSRRKETGRGDIQDRRGDNKGLVAKACRKTKRGHEKTFSSLVIELTTPERVNEWTSQGQWHKWLAHLNMADVKQLASMSTGIDVDSANSLESQESPESVCGACAIGKQNRTPSRKPHTRATKVGELVHTDLAGDGKIPQTDGGSRYVATMIDDYSQMRLPIY